MGKTEHYWLIRGYDGMTKIYEKRVPVGQLTENQLKAVLMALTAKAGLSFDEIVGAYVKKATRMHNDLLCVRRDGPYCRFFCGTAPYFIAEALPRPTPLR